MEMLLRPALPSTVEVVAPQARLRFEGAKRGALGDAVLHIAFFAVNVGGQPFVLAGVHAPAVEIEVVASARRTAVGAVEANDVIVLVFGPDAAGKAALSAVGQRVDIENDAAHFAQKFPANISEFVVLAVETVRCPGRSSAENRAAETPPKRTRLDSKGVFV
jgi:hypothetical protein